jgi:hypothetical protein
MKNFITPARTAKFFLFNCTICLSLFLVPNQTMAQKPVVASFVPSSGPIGTTIQITGSNFNSTPANNIVYFGAVKATVINASATSLSVSVPAGAMYQPISVTVNGLTGWSSTPFSVTFPGGGSGFFVSSFLPKIDSSAGLGTVNLNTADIDGDGKPDVAAVSDVRNVVFVYHNNSTNGSISLSSKITLVTGEKPTSVVFADLDGDGRLDLVIANSGDSSISVLRNTSVSNSISFGSKTDYRTGKSAVGVAACDFDNDGKPDIATVNGADNSVSVLRNSSTAGNISFAPKADFSTGNNPTSIAVSDLNGDGKQDIAVTNYNDNSISVLRNISTSGSIAFNPKVDFPAISKPIAIAIADFDKNNKPDIAIAGDIQPRFTILKNLSTGGNEVFSATTNYAVGAAAYSISVADMDGDGMPDIATANGDASTVSVFKNRSVVDTITFANRFDYSVGNYPYGLSIADMDGDGKPEIISANYTPGTVSVLRNSVTRPYILSFTPTTGGNGALVNIKGINLTGANSVTIGNTPATSFFVDSATSITAVIDTGSTGDIKVITPFGTTTKAGFIFSLVPTINTV